MDRVRRNYRLKRLERLAYHCVACKEACTGDVEVVALQERGRRADAPANPRRDSQLRGEGSMEVHGVGPVHGPQNIEPAHRSEAPDAIGPIEPQDEIEISAEAQALHSVSETPEMRAARLERIRQQIEAGEYDTTERLAAAVDAMLRRGVDLDL
ncbi:MAG: flagellar biosynthesis anti-sigma factor FlgM [Planctomycetota bacterium]|nr:MAG: flagellar biosynthesis anti-sigma factor FlgM [Planctomycetota bacterium]